MRFLKILGIISFIQLISFSLYSQSNDFSIGYLNSVLEKNALRFAIDYSEKLEPKLNLFKPGKNSLMSFSPDLKILLGSEDAFNGIVAKYTGNIMKFKTTTIGGIETPDLSKSFSNFPVSVGIESNKDFSFVSGLVETGYIPWYQNKKDLHKILRETKLGVFVQGGYKFDTSAETDTIININSGDIDQSEEDNDSGLFRFKLSTGFSPKIYIQEENDIGFSLIGNGDAWYDLLNNEIYYHLEGALRLFYKDFFFDIKYEKGSGAPNFNQGDQFSANLGIVF